MLCNPRSKPIHHATLDPRIQKSCCLSAVSHRAHLLRGYFAAPEKCIDFSPQNHSMWKLYSNSEDLRSKHVHARGLQPFAACWKYSKDEGKAPHCCIKMEKAFDVKNGDPCCKQQPFETILSSRHFLHHHQLFLLFVQMTFVEGILFLKLWKGINVMTEWVDDTMIFS